ncbi:MAG: RES domain-containing protein [Chloroflexi bacterium]|nr:RES domain-containing protein [Chloroflexota bacterium]
MLYRVFPWDRDARVDAPGGAMYVARERQSGGRHDNPDHYGALYVTRSPLSAVAERVAVFRGQELDEESFTLAAGRRFALASIDDARLGPLVDLDDPTELVERSLRPSGVATRDRTVTQPIALRLFKEGLSGFSWWSTLNAAWPNVTLFAERALGSLSLAVPPEPLSSVHPLVVEAAEIVGVRLARPSRRLVRVK